MTTHAGIPDFTGRNYLGQILDMLIVCKPLGDRFGWDDADGSNPIGHSPNGRLVTRMEAFRMSSLWLSAFVLLPIECINSLIRICFLAPFVCTCNNCHLGLRLRPIYQIVGSISPTTNIPFGLCFPSFDFRPNKLGGFYR